MSPNDHACPYRREYRESFTTTRKWRYSQAIVNWKDILTTSVNSRRPSVHKERHIQVPGDAAVLKRFFRNNFVIFRRRWKSIALLESVNSYTCAHMQIFNFHDGHVTSFLHPSGAYICQMPGHRLFRLVKGTPSVSAFHRCRWFGVKLFPVGCAQHSRRVP